MQLIEQRNAIAEKIVGLQTRRTEVARCLNMLSGEFGGGSDSEQDWICDEKGSIWSVTGTKILSSLVVIAPPLHPVASVYATSSPRWVPNETNLERDSNETQ